MPGNALVTARLPSAGKRPEVMVIACCDSRTAPETIFSAQPGKIFVLRNVANLVPPYEPDGTYHATSAALERASIRYSIANLRTFPCVSILEDRKRLTLQGAWFDIASGELWTMDGASGDFSIA